MSAGAAAGVVKRLRHRGVEQPVAPLGELKLSDYFEDAEGNAVTTSKSSVTGEESYLAIVAKAAGSVTLTLTVKDGLPGGVSTQDIPVIVRAANAPPVISTALDQDALEAFDKTGADRLVISAGPVTIDIPAMSFVDPNGDALTYEAIIGGSDEADIAANKKVLDAAINDSGDLVLTPKEAPATGADAIPVTIKASDIYGAYVMTATPIDVAVNRPPSHLTYAASALSPPTGKMDTDKAVLADLAVTTFSIASTATATEVLTLAEHFGDADTEDNLTDADLTNGVCNFTTTSDDYATVTFSTNRADIELVGEEQGEFDLIVTCTDTKMESLVDRVTITIIG